MDLLPLDTPVPHFLATLALMFGFGGLVALASIFLGPWAALLAVTGGAVLAALAISRISSRLLAGELRGVVVEAQRLLGADPDEEEAHLREASVATVAGSVHRLGEALQRAIGDLARERDRFESVLSSMEDGVLALSRKGRIKVANPAAARLLGLSEAPSRPLLEEVVREPLLLDLIERAREGETDSIELDLHHLSTPGTPPDSVVGGGPRRILALATPLRPVPGKRGQGCLVVLRDITDLRRLERVRRDFAANVSHELRTPVSVVLASAEALQDGALDDPDTAAAFVDSILRNAQRLGALINDLLSLSRLESGQLALEPRPLHLLEVVEAAVEAMLVKAEARHLALEVDLPEQLVVMADEGALDQVLTNLLDNAIKYTQEGGQIEVGAVEIGGGQVRVEVRDNGPGVPPRHRARLFERFYRVDTGRSRHMGGTGLGLAIVKHTMEVMGGKVGMAPGRPGGSVFWFTLSTTRERLVEEEE